MSQELLSISHHPGSSSHDDINVWMSETDNIMVGEM